LLPILTLSRAILRCFSQFSRVAAHSSSSVASSESSACWLVYAPSFAQRLLDLQIVPCSSFGLPPSRYALNLDPFTMYDLPHRDPHVGTPSRWANQPSSGSHAMRRRSGSTKRVVGRRIGPQRTAAAVQRRVIR
jgi:hypothetical protein